MKPCVVKTSVDGPSANALVHNPSASQRVCSAEWLLSGEPFKQSIFSWSCFQRLSCPFGIVLHSQFDSRAASIEQRPSGLHWIVQQSVCRTYHPLPFQLHAISLYLTVFDVPCWNKVYSFTCTARADTDLKPPPNSSFVKVQVNL
jgi:hypothetical protein